MAACLAGDEASWTALWARHRPYVAAALASWGAGRRYPAPPDIDDLGQALFTRLWADRVRVLGGWKGRASLGHYLAVIAIRMAQRGREDEGAPLDPRLRDPRPLPPERLEARERDAAVSAALEDLAPRERVLVQMVHLDGVSPSEAARSLGLEAGHVRVLLHRSRERLKDLLEQRGFSV